MKFFSFDADRKLSTGGEIGNFLSYPDFARIPENPCSEVDWEKLRLEVASMIVPREFQRVFFKREGRARSTQPTLPEALEETSTHFSNRGTHLPINCSNTVSCKFNVHIAGMELHLNRFSI